MSDRRTTPRTIRRIVQGLTLALFLVFVAQLGTMAAAGLHADWVMRFSPLSGLGAAITSWSFQSRFLPAVILFVLALALGRYFCGWVCPLGTSIDIADRLIGYFTGRESVRSRRTPSSKREAAPDSYRHTRERRAKFYVLIACAGAAFLGVSVFSYFDPLSIAVRSYAITIRTYAIYGLTSLFAAFQGVPGIGPFFGDLSDGVSRLLGARGLPLFSLHFATFAVLLVILGLGLWRRRFWCRNVCPLGALYSLAGSRAVNRRWVTDDCIECGSCVEACPTECISENGHGTLHGECILCMDCQAVCPTDAVRFFGGEPCEEDAEVDVTRRGVAASAGAAAVAYPAFGLSPSEQESKGGHFIRPPLADQPDHDFLERCVRCGQCMEVCPTQAIQPAGLSGGLQSLWSPKVVPRLGYCEYECTQCGMACPTEAIPRFTLEEKHASSMGLAHLYRSRCIPWRGWERRDEEDVDIEEHNCGVCEEVCPTPTKAIQFHVQQGPDGGEMRLPYVIKERCVGCGFCEHSCPVSGEAAIRVSGGGRSIPAPQQEPEAAVATDQALPATTDGFRLEGPKTTYEGGDELFQYINGGAEPYLKFNFIRVTTAVYASDEGQLQVDMWQFESPEAAYGAYARDRSGEPVDIGDESSIAETSVWAWQGAFMLTIIPDRGNPTREGSLELARAIMEQLDAPSAERPALCRALPPENLDEQSVRYVMHPLHAHGLYLANQIIPEGTFGLEGEAVAAVGSYTLQEDQQTSTKVFLLRQTSADAAEEVRDALRKLRSDWGDELVQEDPHLVFKAGDGNFCSIGTRGQVLTAVFFAPDRQTAVELIENTLQRASE